MEEDLLSCDKGSLRRQWARVIDESFKVTEGYLNMRQEYILKYIYKVHLVGGHKEVCVLPLEISIIYKCLSSSFGGSVGLESALDEKHRIFHVWRCWSCEVDAFCFFGGWNQE